MTYNGFYIGIVIQNNDPEHAGRVKILIPNINTALNEWHITDDPTDISFDFTDINTNPKLNAVLNKLKNILPWSPGALPIFGGSSSNIFNSSSNSKESITRMIPSGIPDQFIPRDFNNSGMGMFSIPAVGSHVWVFFKDGDPNTPVYFASAHGIFDYTKMNSNISDGENGGSEDYNHANIINTAKHTIQLDDTDGEESINIIHYNGSNVSYQNDDTNELAIKNKSTYVKETLTETSKNRTSNVNENDQEIIGTKKTITVPELQINCGGTIIVVNDSGVTITTPTTTFNGNVIINGTLVASGTITGSDCISGAISGSGHIHTYTVGSGITNPPS